MSQKRSKMIRHFARIMRLNPNRIKKLVARFGTFQKFAEEYKAQLDKAPEELAGLRKKFELATTYRPSDRKKLNNG